ncbi:hypothetical protein Y032_0104g3608 [Ancylostoma ceylanicum]|uniref:Lipase_GDSL domain-containing protein n=1 Tax=Ancylostoma ceylanicum TaxID=53326 RepID=A0A016TGI1_9BILA|nr:hypothetical protein Y032_0104g3608 [Ancylostoma ceylanicum]
MRCGAGEILRIVPLAVIISSVTAPSVIQQALDAVVEQPAQPPDLLVRGSYLGEQDIEYEYDDPANNTLRNHSENDDEDDSEIDQGDSEISEERCVHELYLGLVGVNSPVDSILSHESNITLSLVLAFFRKHIVLRKISSREHNLDVLLSNDSSKESRNDDRGIFIGERDGLKEVKPDQKRLAPVVVINSAFNNRKTFACPKIKSDLKTGTSIGDLSPEDIAIIASMGDALATGLGLWPKTNIEFRGAAFPSGGDATIDGLVTIPNILSEFNNRLVGVSHGMGTRDQLPETQLSVAESGATTDKMPEQAKELVRRLKNLVEVDYTQHWIMVIVTIGTEEVCSRCTSPNFTALTNAIDILQAHLPRAFVVLLGPIHVSFPHKLKGNLLKSRCECSREASNTLMEQLSADWKTAFEKLQEHVDTNPFRPPTFGILAIPELTITSRYPYGLFIPNKPLLNRRGHNYATKWLWNRLIAGENYNLSAAVLSQDAYFCPSIGCPYFRNTANAHGCQLLSLSEAKEKELLLGVDGKVLKKRRRTPERLYTIAISIVGIAFFVVCTLGTVFYQKSKQGDHGRFEIPNEAQKKFEEAQKEEEKALLTRQMTRGMSVNEGLQKSTRRLTGEEA